MIIKFFFIIIAFLLIPSIDASDYWKLDSNFRNYLNDSNRFEKIHQFANKWKHLNNLLEKDKLEDLEKIAEIKFNGDCLQDLAFFLDDFGRYVETKFESCSNGTNCTCLENRQETRIDTSWTQKCTRVDFVDI